MAKGKKTDEGLPYLKFHPMKWITGDISECSLAAQGLFINLCSLYWSKQGKLSLDAMKRKFPRKSKLFDELLERGILKSNADDIEIIFLDEQLAERGLVSQKNSKAAQVRWNQNKSDADALPTQCERNANAMPREEKREEEKRREESENTPAQNFEYELVDENVPRGGKSEIFESIFTDEIFISDLTRNFPGANLEKAFSDCWLYHSQKPSPPELGWQWRQKLTTWLSIDEEKKKKQPNGTSNNRKQQHTSKLAASVAETYRNVFTGGGNGKGGQPPT